jgi:regulatory protein
MSLRIARMERDNDLRRVAMDLLARREHSRAELRAKLRRRGADAAAIDPVLERLDADGLQSDARYTEALAQSLVRRGKGPLRIRGELRLHGVDDAVIAAALETLNPSWDELATAARCKRFGEALPDTRDERARQARFLEQRGFTAEHIRAALALSRD